MGALGLRLSLLAVALTISGASGVLAASTGLVSHRAIYEMSLKSANQTSDIAELSGLMLIETVDVCDGWTLKQRIALTIANFRGVVVHSYTSFASWESKDGRRFRFEQETKQNDVTVEELGGEAAIAPHGGVAMLDKPMQLNLELAPGTLFPTSHTALLIAHAEAGETFLSRVVFDGTTAEGPNQISAFIGAPTSSPNLAGEESAPEVWPIRLAFYRASSAGSEPDVEIGLLLQANGVTRHMILDYGNFSIEGRLDKLELFPATEC